MKPITPETACFFTQQVFLIGTRDEDGSAHFAPISWISFTWGPPCCLVVSINGRSRKKQTTRNIERTGRLSATIVTPDLLPFAEQNNKATQREGLLLPQEIEPGKVLDVPLLKGAAFSYECEVIQSIPVGECVTFFAAYKHVNVREDVQDLDFFDLRAINPVIYSPNHYFTVGDHLGQIGDFADHRS
ncbi:MAG TPA: flavin reductase [Clostridia bacterium]|nr:flavin reductase [Clostridia bacterium]